MPMIRPSACRMCHAKDQRIAALEAELRTWKLRWAATRHEPPDSASPEAMARDEIAAVGFAETKRRMAELEAKLVEARREAADEAVKVVDKLAEEAEANAHLLWIPSSAIYAIRIVASKLRKHFGLEVTT
jgi:hypothetical protein